MRTREKTIGLASVRRCESERSASERRAKTKFKKNNSNTTYYSVMIGAHYQERDCKVHPAISTVTKVSIFGS